MTPPMPMPPPDAAPLILFGGSFDPPHLGHAHIARHALHASGPHAWLIYVPAARSPFKADSPAAPDDARVEMLRLMVAAEPRCSLWLDELERTPAGQASYTVDTVRRLGEAFPGRPLRLLIGADQAVSFHRWKEAATLLDLAPPLIACRDDAAATREALIETLRAGHAWTPSQLERLDTGCFACPLVDASSTRIRADIRHAATMLHPAVHAYALARGLYSA